jgi:methyl-CpG-binding domain protein 4
MIADEELERPNGSHNPPRPTSAEAVAVSASETLTGKKRPRPPRKNVSRHFKTPRTERKGRSQLQSQEKTATMTPPHTPQRAKAKRRARLKLPQLEPQPPPQAQPETQPRIVAGLNIDEDLSSDSSLTSVPSSIGPDPFLSPSPPALVAVKTRRKRPPLRPTKSPYFPHPQRHKSRPTFISSILPFPPLSAPHFGIMQERLAHDPFRLLIATIFLNKTPGARAMPVFYDLMVRYPTPLDLAHAGVEDVVDVIRCLGFQNQRARKCVALARVWCGLDDGAGEPRGGRRWAKRDYPRKGDGRGMKVDEWVCDEAEVGDGKVAWEISHLPGLGAYAHDSWRMFCRDKLRGLAEGWNGEGAVSPTTTTTTKQERGEATEEGQVNGGSHDEPSPTESNQEPPIPVPSEVEFEPEWKRVLPADKELRAWMTWMWLKDGPGWVWNYKTGERTRASAELMSRVRGGGVVREEMERETLVVEVVEGLDGVIEDEEAAAASLDAELALEMDKPAGAFMSMSPLPSLRIENRE